MPSQDPPSGRQAHSCFMAYLILVLGIGAFLGSLMIIARRLADQAEVEHDFRTTYRASAEYAVKASAQVALETGTKLVATAFNMNLHTRQSM